MASNLKTLIGKLNPTCKDAAEKAINHCISRGQYKIDLEHLLLALLENPRSDFALLCRHYKINSADMEQDLLIEIAELKTGNMRTPVFSTHVSALFEQAWLLASLDSHASRIRSAHVILALLTQPDLMQLVLRGSRQFARFPADEMRNKLAELTANLPEAVESFDAPPISEMHQASRTVASRHMLALDHFTMNLTQLAREGKIDPVIGRDAEIRQMIDILMRRRQNNPILTGEAGVGKTAVVEALAQYLINEDIPPPLRGVELRVLDLGLLQAGANIKGEFEDRLRKVIEEVRQAGNPIILFIDEAHTMIGAGAGAGKMMLRIC